MRRVGTTVWAGPLVWLLLSGCGGEPVGAGQQDGTIVLPDGKVVLADHDLAAQPESSSLDEGVAGEAEERYEPVPENGFDYPCEPLTVESCVTVCSSAGKRKCLKEWGPCLPPGEFCGNCVDDDCDGLVNEGCSPNPVCEEVPPPGCPVALIEVAPGAEVWTGDTISLSGQGSYSPAGPIEKYLWTAEPPPGGNTAFLPSNAGAQATFLVDAAGQYLITLDVWDDSGTKSCSPAQVMVAAATYPPVTPAAGCSDGSREGFLDQGAYPHIAGCSGGWEQPGVTPETVKSTCDGKAGNDSANAEGKGCSAPDLCAEGWHPCSTWKEVAQKSPTGCAGSVPAGAAPKSLFFAIRQPSANGSVCGEWGDGFNDVFGCGNLGAGLGPDKGCGPLDRVLASTQPNTCGFNEAEPPLGPWQCLGGSDSHLNEGKLVTKKGCPNTSCSYDGQPVASWGKGGVLCCRD